MKLLLCAVNAKYIHSNLAVYSLKAYSEAVEKQNGWDVKIKEYTINHRQEDILSDLYKEKPDVVVFSCYIWNISMIYSVCQDLYRVLPKTRIWLGGPEVSYDSEKVLKNHPEIDLIMEGEGEKTFSRLLETNSFHEVKKSEKQEVVMGQIAGITYRDEEGKIVRNLPGPLLSMDEIPFVYQDMELFEHKIIYYETSRGCPFSCSYCLSSIDKSVRFRSFSLVEKELAFFLENRVPQVKFVDRTFNCNREHARQIWNYILERDNGVTNFHFEIAADLLEEEDLQMMARMRPGLIQLEIGVQSTYGPTILEIRRKMDLEKLADRVARVKKQKNIHQHLDLIAGLPYEDLDTFRQSFLDVYAMEPDQLQLGFLKVLKGSYMEERVKDYELLYKKEAPYEVLATKWMSYDDILLLKGVEEMVEVYYNSGQFRFSLAYLMHFVDNAFVFYEKLAAYYEKYGLFKVKHNRSSRYEILIWFAGEEELGEESVLLELLTYDLYLRENMKSRPEWAKDLSLWKGKYNEFFRQIGQQYLGEEEYDSRKAARQNHIEYTSFDIEETAKTGKVCPKECHLLFDYQHRNPLTMDARVVEINLKLIKNK
ncbi:MAG: B12-binding domain-containing radical SAM protein [Lachnospiraceae bacterium]|nr:B12-binding domain-containing radical SAM protein [Lachnospiraceae bacterium]